METDLSGTIDGVAERFVPETMHGRIVEAEHLSRYQWVASLAFGKRVLDAGCGTAYGSAILAAAGAREVVGVDVAADVLAAVSARMPDVVQLREADVSNLPFEAGSFDVIVCFEVIEHVQDADAALDEFARVIAEDGVLAISSPNRYVYAPGNPHHRYEFTPEELEEALGRRFANVRPYRQADWITSAVLDDQLQRFEGEKPLRNIELRKSAAAELGDELYTLALAGNGALPEPSPSAVMGSVAEIKAVAEAGERLDGDRQQLDRDRRELGRRTALTEHEAAEVRRELGVLRHRLLALETELARARQAVARRSGDLETAESRLHELEKKLEETQRQMRADLDEAHGAIREMQATKAWRLATSFWRLRDRLFLRHRAY